MRKITLFSKSIGLIAENHFEFKLILSDENRSVMIKREIERDLNY